MKFIKFKKEGNCLGTWSWYYYLNSLKLLPNTVVPRHLICPKKIIRYSKLYAVKQLLTVIINSEYLH